MKTLARYAGGVVGTVVGFLLGFVAYYILREFGLVITWGGDHAGVVLGLNLGVPLGGTAGIMLVDKTVFKSKFWQRIGMSLSCVAGFLGVRLCIFLGGQFGLKEIALLGVPFITVLFSQLAMRLVNGKGPSPSRSGSE